MKLERPRRYVSDEQEELPRIVKELEAVVKELKNTQSLVRSFYDRDLMLIHSLPTDTKLQAVMCKTDL